MSSYPKEYTPELQEEFYKSMARPIEEGTARNVGAARKDALARGLEGDPFESLGVSSARSQGTNALGDLWANIGMQGAGMAREERVNTENREDTQTYGAEQAKLGRDWQSAENAENKRFQERMTQVNYDNAVGMNRRENRNAYQSELWGAGAKLAGGFLGGLF